MLEIINYLFDGRFFSAIAVIVSISAIVYSYRSYKTASKKLSLQRVEHLFALKSLYESKAASANEILGIDSQSCPTEIEDAKRRLKSYEIKLKVINHEFEKSFEEIINGRIYKV